MVQNNQIYLHLLWISKIFHLTGTCIGYKCNCPSWLILAGIDVERTAHNPAQKANCNMYLYALQSTGSISMRERGKVSVANYNQPPDSLGIKKFGQFKSFKKFYYPISLISFLDNELAAVSRFKKWTVGNPRQGRRTQLYPSFVVLAFHYYLPTWTATLLCCCYPFQTELDTETPSQSLPEQFHKVLHSPLPRLALLSPSVDQCWVFLHFPYVQPATYMRSTLSVYKSLSAIILEKVRSGTEMNAEGEWECSHP